MHGNVIFMHGNFNFMHLIEFSGFSLGNAQTTKIYNASSPSYHMCAVVSSIVTNFSEKCLCEPYKVIHLGK